LKFQSHRTAVTGLYSCGGIIQYPIIRLATTQFLPTREKVMLSVTTSTKHYFSMVSKSLVF